MSRVLVLVLSLAACGRFGFASVDHSGNGDAGGDGDSGSRSDAPKVCAMPSNHDEDGDGDGIGDACDPEPTNGRQHLVLFASMRAADQPLNTAMSTGTWTQNADSIRYDGTAYGGLYMTLAMTNAAFAMGFTVHSAPGTGVQHQLSLYPRGVATGSPFVAVELNQQPTAMAPNAEIPYYDGAAYTILQAQQVGAWQAGTVTLQGTGVIGQSMQLDASYLGMPYMLNAATTMYQGGAMLQLDINHLDIDVDWVWIVGW